MRGRSTKVKKTLIAVYDLCETGHFAHFDLEGDDSYAEHRTTGERIPFTLKGKTWDLDFEVVPCEEAKKLDEASRPRLCPFSGPAGPKPSP